MVADLTKLGFGGILATSAKVFLSHLPKIGIVGLACYVPVELLVIAVAPEDPDPMAFVQTTWALRGLFDLFVTIVAMIFVIQLTAKDVAGEPTDFGAILKSVFPRYFPTVLTSVAYSLVLSGLFFMLVLPAIIGMVYMLFFLQVPVLRTETGFHALKRSKRLVEGRFFSMAGYAILFSGGYQAALFGAEYVASGLGDPMFGGAVMVATSIVTLYFAVAVTVLYLHLEKTRFE